MFIDEARISMPNAEGVAENSPGCQLLGTLGNRPSNTENPERGSINLHEGMLIRYKRY